MRLPSATTKVLWFLFGFPLLAGMGVFMLTQVPEMLPEGEPTDDDYWWLVFIACGLFLILWGVLPLLLTSKKTLSRQERRKREAKQELTILREIERDEFRNLQARWARNRDQLGTGCDQCGRPAVEAKKYSWYQCGHEAILFACEKCALPYQMPCPTCAERKRIALEHRWRWLLKAAAYFHARQRFFK